MEREREKERVPAGLYYSQVKHQLSRPPFASAAVLEGLTFPSVSKVKRNFWHVSNDFIMASQIVTSVNCLIPAWDELHPGVCRVTQVAGYLGEELGRRL